MRIFYTTKYLKLYHKDEEQADVYNFPIIEFFSDHDEIGHNVEISFYEFGRYDYHYTGTHLVDASEANRYFKELLDNGYYVKEYIVDGKTLYKD